MGFWPFRKTEERARTSTAARDYLLEQVTGSGLAPASDTLGVVEAAIGLWSRSLSSATVEPVTPATRSLKSSLLADVGRALGSSGEYLALIEVDAVGVVLRQSCNWVVSGGIDPESWRYEMELAAPGGVVQRRAQAAQVVHIRINARSDSPWRGVSPLASNSNTLALAGWIERRLAQESRTSTGYVLTTPDGQGFDDETAEKLKGLDGKLLALETSAQGWGGGATAAPARKDYAPGRLGFDPPGSIATLRRDVRSDIFGAFGVSESAALGSGAAARESYRRFLATTIKPLSNIVESELSDKLDVTLTLKFPELLAADLSSRSRSYKQLTEAGMTPERAGEIVGFA